MALAVSASRAEQQTVRLGAASVRFDSARWATTETSGSIYFAPRGDAARKLDAVELHQIPDGNDDTCETHATRMFGTGHYDLGAIKRTPMRLGGSAAERFTTHTGCRNATPRGEIACLRVGGSAYLLAALQTGCQGNNLFSGIDPLGEIATGVTFDDARRSP